MFCPLTSTQHGVRAKCDPAGCMLYDNDLDKCLIRKALQVYVAEHSVIIPQAKEPTDEELMRMYQRIKNLPIQPFIYPDDPQDYVRNPLQGGL